ncbi:MAG: hypothetical protein ACR2NN_29915 [Bryobacteraceae bacterium]
MLTRKSNSRVRQAKPRGQRPRAPRSQWGTAEDFTDQNTRAARIILCDTDAHGGDESLAVRWASAFLIRAEEQRTGQRRSLLLEVA